MTNAPNSTATDRTYDFIIVGSGAGGAPLAANLAHAGFDVLLLEAGDWCDKEVSRVPAFHPVSTEDPDLSWDFFVQHYDRPERQDSKWDTERRGIFYPRCSAVGGCTVHNAMITITGPSEDWDEIADLTGDDSWRGARMRSYFERLEHCDYGKKPLAPPRTELGRVIRDVTKLLGFNGANRGRHGFNGWLHTKMADVRLVLDDAELIRVLLQAFNSARLADLEDPASLAKALFHGAIPEHVDPNHWEIAHSSPEGLALIPIAVKGKERSGPADLLRLVQAAYPDRLTIRTNTFVTRVLFHSKPGDSGKPVAIGVEYLEGSKLYRAHDAPATRSGGRSGSVRVREGGEVILAGGAFNTPQLLMLSGVGPADHLSALGIAVRVELPGVGSNLQDRYEVGIVSRVAKEFAILQGLAFGPPADGEPPDAALAEWRAGNGKGLYSTNGAVLGILKKSSPDLPAPDLFIFGLPGSFRGYQRQYSKFIVRDPDNPELERRNLFTWAILKAHTNNQGGTVRLRSKDPLDPPIINFSYFGEGTDAEQEDLDGLLKGVKFVREIMMQQGKLNPEEDWPGEKLWLKERRVVESDEDLRDFIRQEAWGHHASCTCPIGADGDSMAVLDSRFRVRGVDGLRVVDASVFPRIPGIFIVSNVYMISEKASTVIAEEHGKSIPPPLGAQLARGNS